MNDIINNLESIGFSRNESRVYSKILEIGEVKSGVICDKLNIPSSHIYAILNSLIEKGVINFKLVNKVKIFPANDPQTLRSLFIKKKEALAKTEENLNKAIIQLNSLPKHKSTFSDYQYFENLNGIKSLWLEVSSILNPNDSIDVYTGSVKSFEHLTSFYLDEIHKIRIKKDVYSRIILPSGAFDEARLRKKIGKVDIRFIEKATEGEFVVHSNFVLLQHTGETEIFPRGFLIKDKIFNQTFKDIFDKLWKIAKP